MRNIIIYTDKESSEITNLLADLEDCDIRVKNIEDIAEAKEFNPSLIVVDANADKIKEKAMVTKLVAPTLIVADSFIEGMILRGDSYDYIYRPINKLELNLRVSNLLKIQDLKNTINKISVSDELTGLYNRKYLQDRIDAEFSRSRRYNQPMSCLLVDIDYFKVINDMYGYDWGDVLLKRIAEMLKNLIRKEDILVRYGDEEFIVILPNTPEENAFIFAERFRRDIERMEFIPAGEQERHAITISGGISAYPFVAKDEPNLNTLVRYAEHALYNAKERGKNKIVQFSQVNFDC